MPNCNRPFSMFIVDWSTIGTENIVKFLRFDQRKKTRFSINRRILIEIMHFSSMDFGFVSDELNNTTTWMSRGGNSEQNWKNRANFTHINVWKYIMQTLCTTAAAFKHSNGRPKVSFHLLLLWFPIFSTRHHPYTLSYMANECCSVDRISNIK